MIAVIFILAEINSFLGQTLTNYSSQFITFMNMYRYPFSLDINYMKQFLKIGNITKVNATIATNTALFLQNSNKVITLMTVFDESLNTPDTYYPYYHYNFTNKENLSHIDLFYSVISSISSLSTAQVNQTSMEFHLFNSYIKPSYDNMMNKTKNQLQKTFETIFY